MKVRRILVLLAALLAIGSAPSAAYGAAPSSAPGGVFEASSPEPQPERDAAPKLTVLPGSQRVSVAAPTGTRRLGETAFRLFALGTSTPHLADYGAVASVDPEADARLLRASNTPCCVRGPPSAA